MKKVIFLSLIVSFSSLFAQQDKTGNNDDLTKNRVNVPDNSQSGREADYKIIASNEKYIELEFYPKFNEPLKFTYSGEKFSLPSFEHESESDYNYPGKPDLKCRSFAVILPSVNNNTVTILDYDSYNIPNYNLAPVPAFRPLDPKSRNFENMEVMFEKSQVAYAQNTMQPSSPAMLQNIGGVRHLVMGNLVIYPFQYNPASKELIQYSRIHVRINFGQSPQYYGKPLRREEYSLLKDAALNSSIAIGWTNPDVHNSSRNIFNSVMSSGDWYKIEIKEAPASPSGQSEGIYKLSKSFLESSGMSLASVDPRTIKMYSNGSIILPEDADAPRPQDLNEVAIYIEGENDGHFDNNDYILFYAKSVNSWNYTGGTFRHYIDPYSAAAYYWVRINTPGNGRRINLVTSENDPNPQVFSSFPEKLFTEPEINNLLTEGNLWLSEKKSNGGTFNWSNTLHGLEPNSLITYRIKPATRVFDGIETHMILHEDNSNSTEVYAPLGTVSPGGFGHWIWTDTTGFTINSSQMLSEQSRFKATFFCQSPDGDGYFDWMEILYRRRYNGGVAGDYMRFTSPETTGPVQYTISPFSNNQFRIFDVTKHDSVTMIQPLSSTTNSATFQKSQVPGNVSTFIGVGSTGYKTPTGISQKINNQNIHGYADGADFIIITHKDFLPAAQRLKERRESGGPSNPNYLKTYVVDVQSIYNEFSGGIQDPTAIRDFIKYAYDNWQERPVYALFLGDGHLDYKNILVNTIDPVPPYEYTDPQLDQVAGYTTDDYFVQVAGNIQRGVNDQRPDLGHGRVSARTLQEANQYIDKVECYEDPAYNGYWKNKEGFVADDGRTTGGNDGNVHTEQCEQLAELHNPSVFEKLKIYLIAYPTVITASGRRKPGVTADLIKNWNNGLIIVHYTGHGSPEVWAHEYVLEKDVIVSQLHNNCKYPFVSVASCDFSKIDNPISQSGGETIVMAPNRGAIGSIAASRPVYGGQNSIFINEFYDHLMYPRDTLLLQTRFGKAHFDTKQNQSSVNDLKYFLICDPSLRIQIPRFQSRIDSISGLSNDTMRALSRIKIYGSVKRPDNSVWSDYAGKIFLKIFDVTRHIDLTDEDGIHYTFVVPGGIIFSGTQSVRQGGWTVEFIVPRDISYLNQHGHLIDYFYNNQSDGSGEYTNFIVGGINQNAAIDSTGPQIKIFMNTRNFRSGDVVNENFKLLADLFDESGINTTGTIGHKIEATLDNDVNHKYDLTTFYNSDSTYKSGTVDYDFAGISEGKHTLTLKAWDTYNNSSEASVDFNVAVSASFKVTNVYNVPNPFIDYTVFTFQHNYASTINVKIKIYSVAGRLINEITQNGIADKFVSINWTGIDADGEKLGNGVYIYKLIVQTAEGSSVTNTGKLAVLK